MTEPPAEAPQITIDGSRADAEPARGPRSRRAFRRWFLAPLTLAAGVSLFCLLLCELVVRLFLPQTLYTFEKGMFLPDQSALGPPMGWLRDMLASLRGAGVGCANPGEGLKREDFEGRIFRDGRHWNEPGSPFIGAIVAEAIERELDIKAAPVAPRRRDP